MDEKTLDRLRGCAIGAAIGDAMGMPLEFGPPSSSGCMVKVFRNGRLPAGSFTDDTEMALALAESLLAHFPLSGSDLAKRFLAWYRSGPPDIGSHTRLVLDRIAAGSSWENISEAVLTEWPDSAGNGSLMRTWPIALSYSQFSTDRVIADSQLQSKVTHAHPDCMAACALVCQMIRHLSLGRNLEDAFQIALKATDLAGDFEMMLLAAPLRNCSELENSGWVRHTMESAIWGLLTTQSFEEAVVRVINLGGDTDTAGSVTGALAGAAYGLTDIPLLWRNQLRGEWPLRSGHIWRTPEFIQLADSLIANKGP